LCIFLPAHPAVTPLIRFLFVAPALCFRLPSDLQSPGEPLPSANTSPCRACGGLSPPSECALPGAHRVGRGVTPAALSHHRTCGSAYGGSTNTLEPLLSGQQRDQPQAREVGRGERQIHMRGAGIPPRTTAVVGAQPGAVRSESARKQLANPCSPALPLPPE